MSDRRPTFSLSLCFSALSACPTLNCERKRGISDAHFVLLSRTHVCVRVCVRRCSQLLYDGHKSLANNFCSTFEFGPELAPTNELLSIVSQHASDESDDVHPAASLPSGQSSERKEESVYVCVCVCVCVEFNMQVSPMSRHVNVCVLCAQTHINIHAQLTLDPHPHSLESPLFVVTQKSCSLQNKLTQPTFQLNTWRSYHLH